MRGLVSHAEIMLTNQNEEHVVVCISVTGIGYKNQTACTDFPTGVELVDDKTALLIY